MQQAIERVTLKGGTGERGVYIMRPKSRCCLTVLVELCLWEVELWLMEGQSGLSGWSGGISRSSGR